MKQELSAQQSLELIQSMIQKTKANLSHNRFYFLLWGWVVILAILLQFILKVWLQYQHHYLVWLVTIVAVLITVWHRRKEAAHTRVVTYVDESMGNLWLGVGISFFILSFIISAGVGWYNAWPFMIMMYGLGTFISGKILQFKPLIIGGVINWLIAIAAVFVPYNYQLLFAAAAIAISYLVPAYLIKPEKPVK
jgi:hypothetical protein